MKTLAVLASGAGSTFGYLLDHREGFEILALISNRPQCGAVSIAKDYRIPVILTKQENWKEELMLLDPDLVVLAGYLKQIEPELIEHFRGRMINTHPALLPNYGGKGMYGHFVHEAVINDGCPESGCSVHFVDEHYDHGQVIRQARVRVEASDDADSLAQKVQSVEKPLLLSVIKELLGGNDESTTQCL